MYGFSLSRWSALFVSGPYHRKNSLLNNGRPRMIDCRSNGCRPGFSVLPDRVPRHAGKRILRHFPGNAADAGMGREEHLPVKRHPRVFSTLSAAAKDFSRSRSVGIPHRVDCLPHVVGDLGVFENAADSAARTGCRFVNRVTKGSGIPPGFPLALASLQLRSPPPPRGCVQPGKWLSPVLPSNALRPR